MLQKLDWDSSFFKTDVYLLSNFQSISQLKADIQSISSSAFIYINLSSSQKAIVDYCKKKYYLADEKITYSKQLINIEFEDFKECEIYDPSLHDIYLENIYKLAYLSGHSSRFRKDENIPDERFYELYRTWIDNTINKTYGLELFLYLKSNDLAGIATLNKNMDFASIGLLAVDEKFQGQNVGSKLLSMSEEYALNLGLKEMRIATQLENKQACRFYEKQGYKILQHEHVFHFWKYSL